MRRPARRTCDCAPKASVGAMDAQSSGAKEGKRCEEAKRAREHYERARMFRSVAEFVRLEPRAQGSLAFLDPADPHHAASPTPTTSLR
jgi:hypothetical protein